MYKRNKAKNFATLSSLLKNSLLFVEELCSIYRKITNLEMVILARKMQWGFQTNIRATVGEGSSAVKQQCNNTVVAMK